jgi:hypothetical protein
LTITVNAQSTTNLKLTLDFDRDKIGLMDPWDFKMEVLNEGDSTEKVAKFDITSGRVSHYGYIALEIKSNADTLWKNTGWIVNRPYDFNNDFWTPLSPGASTIGSFYCTSPLKNIFVEGLKIRAVYAPFGAGQKARLYSNEKNIHLVKYTGDTLRAFEYLNRLRNPNFIYYPSYSVSGPIDSSEAAHAEYIIEAFPNSSFRKYCEMFLSNYYFSKAIAGTKKKIDPEIVLNYLRKSRQYGLSALNFRDGRFKENIELVLSSHAGLIDMRLYKNYLPKDLFHEFVYPPKN